MTLLARVGPPVVLIMFATSCHSARKTDQAAARASDVAAPSGLAGKRVAPPEVAPITIGALRIEAVHWGKERGLSHNGGYVAAFDASGKEAWTLEIYRVEYDPALESDVQDVFISSMVKGAAPDEIEVADEKGRRYAVNVKTRIVRRL